MDEDVWESICKTADETIVRTNSVNYSHTNAKIYFTRSFEAITTGEVEINICNFSHTDLSSNDLTSSKALTNHN